MGIGQHEARGARYIRPRQHNLSIEIAILAARYYRLTDENSVLQFLPHSGAGVSKNQTSTKVQNAITATQPDKTILISSLSACLSHLRIGALPEGIHR
jgi:hypothetical protein